MKTVSYILLLITLLSSGAAALAYDLKPTIGIVKGLQPNGQPVAFSPTANSFTINIDPSRMRADEEPRVVEFLVRVAYNAVDADDYRRFMNDNAPALFNDLLTYSFRYRPGSPPTSRTFTLPGIPFYQQYGGRNFLAAGAHHRQINEFVISLGRLEVEANPQSPPSPPRTQLEYDLYRIDRNFPSALVADLNIIADIPVHGAVGNTYTHSWRPIVSISEDNDSTGEPRFMITADTTFISADANLENQPFNLEVSVTHHYTFRSEDGTDIDDQVTQTIPIRVVGRNVATVSARWPALPNTTNQLNLMRGSMRVVRDRIVVNPSLTSYVTDPRRTVLVDGPNIPDGNPNDNSFYDFTVDPIPDLTLPNNQALFWSLILAGMYEARGGAGGYRGGNGPRRTLMYTQPLSAYKNDQQIITIDGRELYSSKRNVRSLNYYVIQHTMNLSEPSPLPFHLKNNSTTLAVLQKPYFTGERKVYRVSVGLGKTEYHIIKPDFFKTEADFWQAFDLIMRGSTIESIKTRVLAHGDMVLNPNQYVVIGLP